MSLIGRLNRRVAPCLLVTLAPGTLSAPDPTSAQPTGKVYRVGYLQTSSREAQRQLEAAFEAGLRESGYTVDRDIVVEYRKPVE